MKQKRPRYIRKEIYHPSAILVPAKEVRESGGPASKNYDGDMMSLGSQRYQVFAKSCTCVTCGIVGSFMAKEKCSGSSLQDKWHFNLYAINNQGKEVLMTKDHIIPKSKGGPDTLTNYQTMCERCNSKKGNSVYG